MKKGLAQFHIILIVVAVVIAVFAFLGCPLSMNVLRAPASDSVEVLDQFSGEEHEIGKKRPVKCLWDKDKKEFDCRGENYECGQEFVSPGYDGDMHPLPAECDVDEEHIPNAILDAWNGAAFACDGGSLRDIGCTSVKIKGVWAKGKCEEILDSDVPEPTLVLLTEARAGVFLACTLT